MCALYSTLLLGIALAGCHNSDLTNDLVGSYKGSWIAEAGASPLAKGFLSAAVNPTIELRKDKTFTLTMVAPLEGTYAVTGDNTFDLSTSNMTIHTSASADRKTFTMDMPSQKGGKAQSIIFTKISS
jgi:hypothetical protein